MESAAELYDAARTLADEMDGHYMDQFTFAERATDWRANNNIAESIFAQMTQEPHSVPTWIVCGAGTGGTSATIGRYVRYHRHEIRICVADPEASVFHQHWADRSVTSTCSPTSIIEGVGRPRVEPSFLPDVINRMIAVPDAASIAAARVVSRRLGKPCGGSTGTNVWACAALASKMAASGETGSIVSIICDDGARYSDTIFDDGWLRAQSINCGTYEATVERFFESGKLDPF